MATVGVKGLKQLTLVQTRMSPAMIIDVCV